MWLVSRSSFKLISLSGFYLASSCPLKSLFFIHHKIDAAIATITSPIIIFLLQKINAVLYHYLLRLITGVVSHCVFPYYSLFSSQQIRVPRLYSYKMTNQVPRHLWSALTLIPAVCRKFSLDAPSKIVLPTKPALTLK